MEMTAFKALIISSIIALIIEIIILYISHRQER